MQKHFKELKKNKANYIPLSPLSFLARTADIFGPGFGIEEPWS